MDKSNILHKLFALSVALSFAVGQATLSRTQQDKEELRPELHAGKPVERFVRELSEEAFTIMHSETGKEIATAYKKAAEILKSEVWPKVKLSVFFLMTCGTPGSFIGVVLLDPEIRS